MGVIIPAYYKLCMWCYRIIPVVIKNPRRWRPGFFMGVCYACGPNKMCLEISSYLRCIKKIQCFATPSELTYLKGVFHSRVPNKKSGRGLSLSNGYFPCCLMLPKWILEVSFCSFDTGGHLLQWVFLTSCDITSKKISLAFKCTFKECQMKGNLLWGLRTFIVLISPLRRLFLALEKNPIQSRWARWKQLKRQSNN